MIEELDYRNHKVLLEVDGDHINIVVNRKLMSKSKILSPITARDFQLFVTEFIFDKIEGVVAAYKKGITLL